MRIIISQDQLNQIMDNHEAMVETQRGLSFITCALLIMELKKIRKSLGVHSSTDVLEENEEFKQILEYIQHHNLFLYLVLAQRFDLIREFFFDKIVFRKEIYLAEKIERFLVNIEDQQRQITMQAHLKAKNSLPIIENQNTNRSFPSYLDLMTVGLSNMDALFYCEKEIERFEHKRHENHIIALNDSFKQRAQRMDYVIHSVFQRDNKISSEDKKMFIDAFQQYNDNREKLVEQSIALIKSGTNLKALGEVKSKIMQLDSDFKDFYISFVTPYDNRDLDKIKQEEIDSVKKVEEEFKKIDKKRDEKISTIKVHQEKILQTTLKEADIYLTTIHAILKPFEKKIVESKARANYLDELDAIATLKETLSLSTNTQEIQQKVHELLSMIHKVKNLIDSSELPKDFHHAEHSLKNMTHYAGSKQVKNDLIKLDVESRRSQLQEKMKQHEPVALEQSVSKSLTSPTEVYRQKLQEERVQEHVLISHEQPYLVNKAVLSKIETILIKGIVSGKIKGEDVASAEQRVNLCKEVDNAPDRDGVLDKLSNINDSLDKFYRVDKELKSLHKQMEHMIDALKESDEQNHSYRA